MIVKQASSRRREGEITYVERAATINSRSVNCKIELPSGPTVAARGSAATIFWEAKEMWAGYTKGSHPGTIYQGIATPLAADDNARINNN